jgi:hypothetical protein
MALEAMRIVTGCKTAEQFVAVFHRFCDAKTCFIPSRDPRPVDTQLAFSLRLLDGTPMLRGTCVVQAAYDDHMNPYKRRGMVLALDTMTPESEALFELLLSQKTAITDGTVEEVARADTNQHVPRNKVIDLLFREGNAPVFGAKDTVEMPPFERCELDDAVPAPADPAETERHEARETRTLLGMPPLAAVTRARPTEKTTPLVRPRRTLQLAPISRPPAPALMRTDQRFWYLCALGAGLFVAALVLASAYIAV